MGLPDPDKLRIVFYPDPILKKVCAPVTQFDSSLQRFAEGMIDLMRRDEGVGLAAPQVGVLIRLFVCNVTGLPEDSQVYVNPRFADLTGAGEAEEGCLSIPDVHVTMRRATTAVIEAQTTDGKAVRVEGSDLLARVWQHEADHLEGRLIVDTMSVSDEISTRRVLKQLRADFAATHKG